MHKLLTAIKHLKGKRQSANTLKHEEGKLVPHSLNSNITFFQTAHEFVIRMYDANGGSEISCETVQFKLG